MNRKSFKLAACGLMLTLAMPVMGQGTDEYLQPCDVTFKVVAMGGGNIFDDPEGFDNQMKVSGTIPVHMISSAGLQRWSLLLRRVMRYNAFTTGSHRSAGLN